MGALRITDFGGAVPIIGDRALPDNFAVESVNTQLYSKELRGIAQPESLGVAAGAGVRALRLPLRTVGGNPDYPTLVPPTSFLGDSHWETFADKDTDIVRSQLVNDSFERWYFCSPSTGPVFNTYARLIAGDPNWRLGVPGPDPTLAPPNDFRPVVGAITGGTTPLVTRFYVVTWVNIYGEESAPTLPSSTATGNANGVWPVSNIKDPPLSPAYAPYAHKFIYRSVTSASGVTTFYRVASVPLGTFTYSDNGATFPDSELVSRLPLETAGWDIPPTDMQGFIAMPNGYLIGFKDNDIYFSESYHFHAWPPAYTQASEYRVVGLGVLGQTCVICTEGFPATITGARPVVASFTKFTTGEPALSRGSIVSTPDGVLYASQNGLVIVGPGGIANITEKIINREDWLRDYAPAHIRAVRFQNGYLALCDVEDPSGGGGPENFGFFIDPSDLKVAITTLSEFDDVVSVDVDRWSGECFLIEGGEILRYSPPVEGQQWPVRWKSKEFQLPQEVNFGCYSIYWDAARFYDSAIGTDILAHDAQVRFRVWAGRQLIYDQTVPKNGKGVRLPSGFKSDIWQFEIRARAPVYSLHVAQTMRELKQL